MTMPIKVRIPSPLRSYTNGADVVETAGASVGEVLGALKDKASGIETRLFKGPNQLNRFVNVYLNDEDIRFLKNLETPVKEGDEISIVPAIAGGREYFRGREGVGRSGRRAFVQARSCVRGRRIRSSMPDESFTRRQVLSAAAGAATAATASGLSRVALGAASSEPSEPPRLPLKILRRDPLSDESIRQIRSISPQIEFLPEGAPWREALGEADVIFAGIGPADFKAAAKLRWLQYPSAGVENICGSRDFVESDVILTNGQGCYSAQIAEHAFGLLFGLTRNLALNIRRMREKKWGGNEAWPIELRGMTAGIIGLGGNGRAIARRARAMDMKTIAMDAEPMYAERFAMVDEVRLVEDGLSDMLRRADVVFMCAPITPRSHGMLGPEQFAAMKRGAYFINISRGKTVQTPALVEALKSGRLAGAGLDVTDPEPLPPDHVLWELPNVIITPHIAGQSQLGQQRLQTIFVENVRRFVVHQPMLNLADKRKGY
jgi:phosphoglycerate dehydrogenase-like enzyme/molybdopterin converting factor small subunit